MWGSPGSSSPSLPRRPASSLKSTRSRSTSVGQVPRDNASSAASTDAASRARSATRSEVGGNCDTRHSIAEPSHFGWGRKRTHVAAVSRLVRLLGLPSRCPVRARRLDREASALSYRGPTPASLGTVTRPERAGSCSGVRRERRCRRSHAEPRRGPPLGNGCPSHRRRLSCLTASHVPIEQIAGNPARNAVTKADGQSVHHPRCSAGRDSPPLAPRRCPARRPAARRPGTSICDRGRSTKLDRRPGRTWTTC